MALHSDFPGSNPASGKLLSVLNYTGVKSHHAVGKVKEASLHTITNKRMLAIIFKPSTDAVANLFCFVSAQSEEQP